MVNFTVIGSLVLSSVILSGIGYYYLETRPDSQYEYGEKEHLRIPDAEMAIIERNFKNDGGFIKYPTSWNYKSYSTPFNGKCKERPYVVFMPGSYENAQEALIAFKTYEQQFTIMGGGHDFECVSMGKGALLNLGLLNDVTTDFEAGIVTVQAGARWRDVYPHVFDTGYELMGGLCPDVGVSGFLLGTGFNWKLSPLYGSGAQNVIEMKAILENGLMVTLTRDNQYKDLMWGMLGAGGQNFGLALEFKIKLNTYPQMKYNWMLMGSTFSETDTQLPGLDEMVSTVGRWVKFFNSRRPNNGYGGNTIIIFREGISKTYTVTVQGICKDCKWSEEVKEITDTHPLQFTQYMDEEMSWGEYETKYPEGAQTTTDWVSYPGIFLSDLLESSVENIISRYIEEDLYVNIIEITTFEGSVRERDYTSFAYPQGKWKVAGGMIINDPQYAEYQKFAISTWKEIVKTEAGRKYLGEYINYIDFNTENYQKEYFGGNLKKLVRIKDKYDPENFFSRPFGIPASK